MKDNELYENAEQLRKQHTQLSVAQHSLTRLTVAKQTGDWFTIKYIIQTGELDDLVDLIDDIKTEVLRVSNEICPD